MNWFVRLEIKQFSTYSVMIVFNISESNCAECASDTLRAYFLALLNLLNSEKGRLPEKNLEVQKNVNSETQSVLTEREEFIGRNLLTKSFATCEFQINSKGVLL